MSFQPNLDTYHITQVFTWISLFTHYPQAPTKKRIAEAGNDFQKSRANEGKLSAHRDERPNYLAVGVACP